MADRGSSSLTITAFATACGAPHGWKQFTMDQIHELRVLERRFAGTRADRAQHHRGWDTLFARVA
jgi:hypothetical protein